MPAQFGGDKKASEMDMEQGSGSIPLVSQVHDDVFLINYEHCRAIVPSKARARGTGSSRGRNSNPHEINSPKLPLLAGSPG